MSIFFISSDLDKNIIEEVISEEVCHVDYKKNSFFDLFC